MRIRPKTPEQQKEWDRIKELTTRDILEEILLNIQYLVKFELEKRENTK